MRNMRNTRDTRDTRDMLGSAFVHARLIAHRDEPPRHDDFSLAANCR
jgi:hypothetical protein